MEGVFASVSAPWRPRSEAVPGRTTQCVPDAPRLPLPSPDCVRVARDPTTVEWTRNNGHTLSVRTGACAHCRLIARYTALGFCCEVCFRNINSSFVLIKTACLRAFCEMLRA